MKIDLKLYNILKPYDDWHNDGGKERNLKAKAALIDFYWELKKRHPYGFLEDLTVRRGFHMIYLNDLMNAKRAFKEKKYLRVCNEIISLMGHEPLLQGRILYGLLRTLELEFPELTNSREVI